MNYFSLQKYNPIYPAIATFFASNSRILLTAHVHNPYLCHAYILLDKSSYCPDA